MQPKLKPETAARWNGPNQETEASKYLLHFVLFLNVRILQVWRSIMFYCRDNSKTDSLFCCFMQNSLVIKLRSVLDIKSVLSR